MVLDSGLERSVVYYLCFWYCFEGSGGYHEVSDDFSEVSYFNLDVLKEYIDGPSPNDHDFLVILLIGRAT